MIIELFIIYVLVVLATVVIKAIDKIGQSLPNGTSFEDVKEQYRKNREEIKELKAKIKAAGLDTIFSQKGKKSKSSIFYGR